MENDIIKNTIQNFRLIQKDFNDNHDIDSVSINTCTLLTTRDNVNFLVPEYQRQYSWTKINVEELFNDILDLLNTDNLHFMGPIVVDVENLDSKNYYEIIDGQQRIITISIIIKIIYEKIKEIDDQNTNLEHIKKYLYNYDRIQMKDKIKLTLGNGDKERYENFLNKSLDQLKGKEGRKINFIEYNALTIIDLIKKNIDIEDSLNWLIKMFRLISTKLYFITIVCGNDVDAYTYFETLNDRGLKLSQVDLIKNKLFSIASRTDKFNIVKNIWYDLIQTFNDKLKDYIRHYYINKIGQTSSQQLYKTIKQHLNSSEETALNFINDLNNYKNIYLFITDPSKCYINFENHIDKENFILILEDVNGLNFSMLFPILMKALISYSNIENKSFPIDENNINKTIVTVPNNPINLYQVFKIARNSFIRNQILNNDVRLIEKKIYEICNSITQNLDDFIQKIKENTINDEKTLDLLKIHESSRNSYEEDMFIRMYINKYANSSNKHPSHTIEHIYPETPTDLYWKSRFTEDDFTYKQRLGNLTFLIMEDNRESGNKPYPDKKSILIKSIPSYSCNKYFENIDDWDKKSIEDRQNIMATFIAKVISIDTEDLGKRIENARIIF